MVPMLRDGPNTDAPDPDGSAPAHLTRTSFEFLGKRPLPRVIAARPVVYVLGPPGVGKTLVARRLAADAMELDGAQVRELLVKAARHRGFPRDTQDVGTLILDGVDCLHGRYGAVTLLGELLRGRAERGLKTVVVQGQADGSVSLLFGPVPCHHRASVLLRFPVGRGRRRHVLRACADRGVPFARAREAVAFEPWTYRRVAQFLDTLADPRGS